MLCIPTETDAVQPLLHIVNCLPTACVAGFDWGTTVTAIPACRYQLIRVNKKDDVDLIE